MTMQLNAPPITYDAFAKACSARFRSCPCNECGTTALNAIPIFVAAMMGEVGPRIPEQSHAHSIVVHTVEWAAERGAGETGFQA